MPKHQQRQRKTPYVRPPPPPEKQGLFSRIKSFFWGTPAPVELPPPRVIASDANTSVDNSFNSRITHSSIDASTAGQGSLESSSFRAPQPGESSLAGLQGPNEALRQFFEDKGGEDLSNMEIVGVLSLIGQAVGRNESLVDFSNLSELGSFHSDQTPADASILRALNVPPSPRPYLKGTPPPSQVRTRSSLANESRSPWASPRPSRIGARHSIGFGGRPTPRSSKPLRAPSTRERSVPTEAATPAALAILKTLDAPNKRVLSRDATPATSTPFKEPASHPEISELAEPRQIHPISSPLNPNNSQAETSVTLREAMRSPDIPASLLATTAQPVVSKSAPVEPETPASRPEEEELPSFEFTIPQARTSRQMTPAEEEFVAQSQNEFRF